MRLAAIAVVLAAFIAGCGGGSGSSLTVNDSTQAVAIAQAKMVFRHTQASGRDLSPGPCIAEQLPELSDWAVDIAHDPRQAVDDEPGNQCQSFRDGRTHHFVELTPDGQLIRAQ
jgi:hypothetical protein